MSLRIQIIRIRQKFRIRVYLDLQHHFIADWVVTDRWLWLSGSAQSDIYRSLGRRRVKAPVVRTDA